MEGGEASFFLPILILLGEHVGCATERLLRIDHMMLGIVSVSVIVMVIAFVCEIWLSVSRWKFGRVANIVAMMDWG